MSKIKKQQLFVINKVYTKINNVNKIPYKYPVMSQIKLNLLLHKKNVKMGPKKEFRTKPSKIGKKNLRQPKKQTPTLVAMVELLRRFGQKQRALKKKL